MPIIIKADEMLIPNFPPEFYTGVEGGASAPTVAAQPPSQIHASLLQRQEIRSRLDRDFKFEDPTDNAGYYDNETTDQEIAVACGVTTETVAAIREAAYGPLDPSKDPRAKAILDQMEKLKADAAKIGLRL